MYQRCWKCGRGGGNHDLVCPEVVPSNLTEYERGYNQGRSGKPRGSDVPAYRLGYRKGEAALEAAENGCNHATY